MRKTFIQTIIAVLICVFLVAVGATAVTVIFPSQGGTGISTYTTGDILYSDATNSLTKLGIGGEGEYLKVDSGATSYTWGTPAGAGDVESVGDCASGACLDGSSDGGIYIRLYDGDSNYAELNVGNIASDYIVYLPTSTGTLIHTEVDPTVDTAAEILVIIDNTALDFGTGVLTATGFSGPLTGAVTGNASTASALAADPANCGAGEYALGVDASGAVESCTDATTEINAVINGAGGTNLTCSSQTCNVDDSFIKLVGDTTGALTEDLNIDANIFVISYDDNKVGIGTASPNAPLEVKGAKPAGNVGGHQSGMFHVTGAGTAEFSNSVITGHSAYDTNTQLWYLGNTSSEDNNIAFINRQNAAIHFSTNNALKMIIEAAGDVGIGVTDPDTKLEILNAGDQLKLSFDGTDNTIFAVDTSGDLTITPSGTQIIVSGNISATNLSGTNTGDNDEVGTLTNTKWCTTDGSVVNCATNAPVLTEVDPNVNTESEIEAITGVYFGASKAVTAGYIWVADGTDFESVIMSNDCTLASGGAITCDHDALDNFLAAEHIDWAGASAGTIHIDNYIENATHTGDVTGSGALTIAADKVLESHLKAVDEAADEECLTYESTTGDFEWQACGGTPTVITVADTTDTTSYVALWESATGDLEPKSDLGLTYNATTGMLTATGFTGPLTGNADTVTGFTPASGSLTLAGADALTITTTGATNSTLPLGTKTLVATDVATLSSLTSIGTIGTGVWEATDIGVTHGGTGVSAFTQYLLMYADTTTSFGQIAIGSAGQVLTSGGAGSAPAFETLSIAAGEYAADSIDFADIVDADQATTKCILIETPADADDLMFFRNNRAATVTSVDCIVEAATSAVVVIVECDSAGDNCGTSRFTESLTCDVDGATDDGVAETGIVAGAWLRVQVGTVTGTPGHVTACITFTYDD